MVCHYKYVSHLTNSKELKPILVSIYHESNFIIIFKTFGWHVWSHATIPSSRGRNKNPKFYWLEKSIPGTDGIHQGKREIVGNFWGWMNIVILPLDNVGGCYEAMAHKASSNSWTLVDGFWTLQRTLLMHHGRIGLTYLTYLQDPHEQTFENPMCNQTVGRGPCVNFVIVF